MSDPIHGALPTPRLRLLSPPRSTPAPMSDHSEEADMTAPTLIRPPVSPAARMLLDRSSAGLLQACAARSAGERYVAAHLSALRAAAAVLAVRGRPTSRGGPQSVWEVLPRVAPELEEWAAFFSATASRRAAVDAGRGDVIRPRDADDLLRDAETFHHVVETALGLPFQQVLPGSLPACG
jgi:SAV_6107-like HEPN